MLTKNYSDLGDVFGIVTSLWLARGSRSLVKFTQYRNLSSYGNSNFVS
ncbi:hypothetical protein G3T18_08105 [Oscillatoria salina IIICB1]|nr:hypothetical protein [Oscillatoria salina IIICB1]